MTTLSLVDDLDRWRRWMSRQRLQMLTGDPILLADPDRRELAVADVIPYGPHVQTESFGDLLDRIQLLGHGLGIAVMSTPINTLTYCITSTFILYTTLLWSKQLLLTST